jgi:hypothetical protein
MDIDAKAFSAKYPVAKAGLVLDQLGEAAIRDKISELLGADKLVKARTEMRDYYFENASAKDLTKLFVNAVRKTLGK